MPAARIKDFAVAVRRLGVAIPGFGKVRYRRTPAGGFQLSGIYFCARTECRPGGSGAARGARLSACGGDAVVERGERLMFQQLLPFNHFSAAPVGLFEFGR